MKKKIKTLYHSIVNKKYNDIKAKNPFNLNERQRLAMRYIRNNAYNMGLATGLSSNPYHEETSIQNSNNSSITNSNNFYAPNLNSRGINIYDNNSSKLSAFIRRYASPNYLTFDPYSISLLLKSSIFTRNIIEMPINDAFMSFALNNNDDVLDNNDIQLLERKMQELMPHIIECLFLTKAYGGAFVVFQGDNAKLDQPLNYKQGDKIKMSVSERWALTKDINDDKYSFTTISDKVNDAEDKKEILSKYNVLDGKSEFVYIQNIKVHKSRVVCVPNKDHYLSIYERNLFGGWGQSFLESASIPIQQYLTTLDSVTEVIKRQQYDVKKTNDLNRTLLTNNEESLKQHMSALEKLALNKEMNLIEIDGKDDYSTINNPIKADEIVRAALKAFASQVGIPYSKISGEESSGMQGVGENANERTYNQRVERERIKYGKLPNVVLNNLMISLFGISNQEANIQINYSQERRLSQSERIDLAAKYIPALQQSQELQPQAIEELNASGLLYTSIESEQGSDLFENE